MSRCTLSERLKPAVLNAMQQFLMHSMHCGSGGICVHMNMYVNMTCLAADITMTIA